MTPNTADQVDEQVLGIVGGAPLATWQAVVLVRDGAPAPPGLALESFADGAEAPETAP